MSQANMDLGVFQKIKSTRHIYTHEYCGYKVVATEDPSAHIGGIAIFYRMTEHFYMEAFQAAPNWMHQRARSRTRGLQKPWWRMAWRI